MSSNVSATPTTHKGPIGKKELLKWSSDISGLAVKKLEDYRDGVVFVKIFSRIWPRVVDLKRIKWKVRRRF